MQSTLSRRAYAHKALDRLVYSCHQSVHGRLIIAAAKFDVEPCHSRQLVDDDSITIDGLVTEPAGLCTIAEILPSQKHLPMLVRLAKRVKPSVCRQSGFPPWN